MQFITFVFIIALGMKNLTNIVQSLDIEEIRGGSVARKGQLKYQLVLLANGKIKCGAGVIGKEFALAAAQCFIDTNTGTSIHKRFILAAPFSYNVLLHKFTKIYKISKVYIPNYYQPYNPDVFTPYRTEGDIAVIKMKRPFELNTNNDLQKLELPIQALTFVGKNATVAGQGCKNVSYIENSNTEKVKEIKESDNRLSFIKTKVSANSDCDAHYFYPIYPTHICARAYPRKDSISTGTCLSDNGSPLVYDKKTVIGILISSPLDCNEDRLSAIYTRVSFYTTFIKNAMKNITFDMKILTLTKVNRFRKHYQLVEDLLA